jgi:hypothetical protein
MFLVPALLMLLLLLLSVGFVQLLDWKLTWRWQRLSQQCSALSTSLAGGRAS